ncbi:hypothetical protein [Photobacterium iliopiscarium]|uniref:hypothetical protein n=1 Tax=Photobacterium iliopiscarium TaxID=56192 RepID=UPI00399D5250
MNRWKHGIARKEIFTLSTLSFSCLLAFNAQAAIDCTNISEWDSSKVYNGGDKAQQNNSPELTAARLTLDTCIDTLPPVDNKINPVVA